MYTCLMPISLQKNRSRLANWPRKPQVVVSGSPPQTTTMSLFSEMSFTMLSAGLIMPIRPLPHTCLAPQYQPSQLSGLRTCWVKPPILSSRSVAQPWGACTILHSP